MMTDADDWTLAELTELNTLARLPLATRITMLERENLRRSREMTRLLRAVERLTDIVAQQRR